MIYPINSIAGHQLQEEPQPASVPVTLASFSLAARGGPSACSETPPSPTGAQVTGPSLESPALRLLSGSVAGSLQLAVSRSQMCYALWPLGSFGFSPGFSLALRADDLSRYHRAHQRLSLPTHQWPKATGYGSPYPGVQTGAVVGINTHLETCPALHPATPPAPCRPQEGSVLLATLSLGAVT